MLLARAAESEPLPISVTDIIEATRIAEPDVRFSSVFGLNWAVSPDGRQVVYVTSTGNLASNRVIYRLVRRDLEKLCDAAASAHHPQKPEDVLLEFASSERFLFEHAIRQVRWLDDRTLVFLGENADKPTQVHTFHIPTRRLARITAHPQPVLSFEYDPHSGRTVYVSDVPRVRYDVTAPAFVVGNGSLNLTLFPERSSLSPPLYQFYSHFAGHKSNAKAGVPLLPEAVDGWLPSMIRLSPDGRYAISRITVTEPAMLRRWAEQYAAIRGDARQRALMQSADEYTRAFTYTGITQFVLMPLEGGHGKPLFDAPDGNAIGGWAVDAAWLPDSKSVILGNTMLPLNGVDAVEQGLRSQAPAVVEYEIDSGRVSRITNLPTRKGADRLFSRIELDGAGRLLVHWTSGPPNAFRKKGDGWVSVDIDAERPSSAPVALSLRENMNMPPKLMARCSKDQGDRMVLDLGAQFADRRLAPVEAVNWVGKDGSEWRGGLMSPPDADTKSRRPLVIQTYGFDPDRFVLDGAKGMSSAYAAQAMAGRGMRVLLLPVSPEGEHTQAGLKRYQAGIEAAIDYLDGRGLIDRGRVGLIGFSAMGNVARHMITFSDYDFAAATIADSWSYSLFGYAAYLYGWMFSMESAERALDAKPWGSTLETWVRNDPSLHTDRISAAVRIENYSLSVPPHWDLYALLRRQHKPAEMVVFPQGDHQLRQPRQRWASLEGNVDWFAFWLLGQESADASKAEQYARWRAMRALRPASDNRTAPH